MLPLRAPDAGIWLGALVLALHLLLLPWVERVWRTTGDEPHYLLTTHSLIRDGDFDLRNNYSQQDYLNFYYSPEIVPQIRLWTDGSQILDHYLGLSVLVAPAYALGGRLGVLLFQAVLSGGLAWLTYRLVSHLVSDRIAAFSATLFVMLSPPLFQYTYLIYPELVAALAITGALVLIVGRVRHNAWSPLAFILLLVIFALLPWLNRRFVALAFCLALPACWVGWRGWRATGWLPLLVTGLSTGLVFWFNRQFVIPVQGDINVIGAGGSTYLLRLLRSPGWLVDQQRGLFIFGPIYITALLGLPLIFRQRAKTGWLIGIAGLPFAASLGMTILAEGYWIAWELGPRFLVAALPGLAPLMALAWQTYGRNMGGRLAILLLFVVSLWNGGVILQNPELPYKSSLPFYYQQTLTLPLTEYLPDFARRQAVRPSTQTVDGAALVDDNGTATWFAPAGAAVNVLRTPPFDQLPYGHYRLRLNLRSDPNLPSETELLRLSLQTLGGGQVFSHLITAADLPTDGGYATLSSDFLNPNFDRWRTPLVLHAISTGQANLWLQQIDFLPHPFFARWLPYLYLLGLTGLAIFGTIFVTRRETLDATSQAPKTRLHLSSIAQRVQGLHRSMRWHNRDDYIFVLSGWGVIFLLLLGAGGYLVREQIASQRVYDAAEFLHFVGQPIADPAAADGQAWLVDPLQDPPQKAIYGPFDFYDPGAYRITYRLKLPAPTEVERPIAQLRVSATAEQAPLLAQPLLASHFSAPEQYHLFVLTVNNPRRQALSFEVAYTGLSALVIDEVIVEREE